MRACSQEADNISSLFLDIHHQEELNRIIEEIENNTDYDTVPLWEFQKSLVEIDSYKMLKNIMLPLQFARDEIEIYNINYNANYVILYCNKYLEEAMRYFLSIYHPVMKLRYRIANFSSLLKNLENYDSVSKDILEGLKLLHSIKLKLETGDEFSTTPKDAIVTYICSLIIGRTLLELTSARIKKIRKKNISTAHII
jgi:hypothetical protein